VKFLEEQGYTVDRKRVRRLMQRMGLETIYPKPHLSQPGSPPVRYPYLLRGMSIDRIDQVWSSDVRHVGAFGIPVKTGKGESKIPLGCWLTWR